jgi:hypothetical protein
MYISRYISIVSAITSRRIPAQGYIRVYIYIKITYSLSVETSEENISLENARWRRKANIK